MHWHDWTLRMLPPLASRGKKKLCAFNCGDTRRKEREWIMGADVVFVQCNGGPPGREAVFVGLEGGKLFKVFVDNPFPIEILETSSGKNITGLSTSSTRSKLAVVDEEQRLVVYEIQSRTKSNDKENKPKPSSNQPSQPYTLTASAA